MKKLIIFDLDGTVLNTIGGIGSACNEMLAQLGLPTWNLEDYEKKVGDGSRMLIKRALPAEKAAIWPAKPVLTRGCRSCLKSCSAAA